MVDWDRLAPDFARHRQRHPALYYDWLATHDALAPGLRALDLGAGTADVARGLAERGLAAVALDPSRALLATAAGGESALVQGRAEALPFRTGSFDLVTCASAWHWVDAKVAGPEVRRVLREGGALAASHFVWSAEPETPGAVTNRVLLEFQDDFDQSRRTGRHPEWIPEIEAAGFSVLSVLDRTFSLECTQESWRGRIRASVPVLGRLDPPEVESFDRRHAAALRRQFGQSPLRIPHRLYGILARVAADPAA